MHTGLDGQSQAQKLSFFSSEAESGLLDVRCQGSHGHLDFIYTKGSSGYSKTKLITWCFNYLL